MLFRSMAWSRSAPRVAAYCEKNMRSMESRTKAPIGSEPATRSSARANDGSMSIRRGLPELREWLLAQSELVFVIGGASLFESLKDDVSRLYLTEIEETFEGDTVMPKLDLTKFTLLEKKVGQIDTKNRYPHTFYVYERK